MASLYLEHAREILGVGDEYKMASWDAKDALKLGPCHPNTRIKVTLAIAPLLEDGRVAWAYEEKGTRKKAVFTNAEHDAWMLEWEKRTGLCHQCDLKRPGQEYMGFDQTGSKFQTCSRCGGTGKGAT